MSLLLKNNAIFLHIPKTGGMWVESVLYGYHLVERRVTAHRHADFDKATDFLRSGSDRDAFTYAFKRGINKAIASIGVKAWGCPVYPERLRFCFVRHPVAWYESWFNYTNPKGWHEFGKAGDPERWHPLSGLNGMTSSDFNTFISNVIRLRPGFVSHLYASYAKPGIGFVGKTENLANDLSAVLTLMGIPHDRTALSRKPPANVSSGVVKKPEWDPKLKDQIMRLEMPALVQFGYLTEAEKSKYGMHIS